MSASARTLALRRLLRIEGEGAYVSRVAGGDIDADDPREERQAAEYVAGVTRLRRRLDALIAAFYRGDPEHLEPPVRQALRIGLYDLLELGTPPHAAVHEAVELAKRGSRPQAGRLVNGILRAVVRRRDALPEPATGNPTTDLGTALSYPDWLVARWRARYGDAEARALLEAGNARPRYALRVNTRRQSVQEFTAALDALGVGWEGSRHLDDFVVVDRLQPLLRKGWLDDGRCAVQDEAAGLVVRVLDPQPGETVADVAAAPGGKAVYAALRMDNRGRLLAFDIHPPRAGLVRKAAEAHGLSIIEAEAADLRALAARPDRPSADRVLLDAPCSGLGVLAKRADLRWRREEREISELAALQDDLLDAAAELVRPGGLLVYSTCTTEPEENEDRVEAFLQRQPAFRRDPAPELLPPEMMTPAGDYLALPHRHGTDGAYAARLRRAG